MRYIDTRGEAPPASFTQVLLAGTTSSGGLYMPESYPKLDLKWLRGCTYGDIAAYIFHRFAPDIPMKDMNRIIRETYNAENFGTKKITPIEWLEQNLGLLQLSNGPTLAFKDLAMKLVARLMDYVLKKQGRRAAVVVSTSGDTGGAAVDAFRGLECIDLFVLYPEGRVSEPQQLMITTASDANVHAISVAGTFDDCQDIVKVLFSDHAFSEKFGLAGVNSINWARIAAQVVYWVFCGMQAHDDGAEHIMISVPTGNFGDVFAAHIARQMGTPIRTIIVATNQNDVLDRFFKTGIYQKGKEVLPSSSPSMDIQVASNFERLLFDLAEGDGKIIAELYRQFQKSGQFNARFLLKRLGNQWVSGSASEADVDATIRTCYHTYGRIIDPHTAVGMCVGLRHRERGVPLIVAETAKPQKFPEAIKRAIGVELSMPEAWQHLKTLPERIHRVGVNAEEVKKFIATNVQ